MKSIVKNESQIPKELIRTFELKISRNLFPYRKWAKEVIDGIENDRLFVISANKRLSLDWSKDGFLNIDSYFKKQVSIKEWLPIACQYIRRQSGPLDDFEHKAIACYKSNAAEILFPIGIVSRPPGPVAFNGAIIFNDEFFYHTKYLKIQGHKRNSSLSWLMNWFTFLILCDCLCQLSEIGRDSGEYVWRKGMHVMTLRSYGFIKIYL